MASKLLIRTGNWKTLPTKRLGLRFSGSSNPCDSGYHAQVDEHYHGVDKYIIGKREVVGFGVNGMTTYADRYDRPFPAIRWGEEDSTIKALREKEKGDWRKLTIPEKKALYRFNFRQTLVECDAITGEWKSIIGFTFFGVSLGLWLTIIIRKLWMPPLPETFDLENQQAQLLRVLDSNMYAVTGVTRDWDQENRRWKEQ